MLYVRHWQGIEACRGLMRAIHICHPKPASIVSTGFNRSNDRVAISATKATKSSRRVDTRLEPSPKEPKLDSIFERIVNSADLQSQVVRPWQVDVDLYEPLSIETARLIPIMPVNAKLASIDDHQEVIVARLCN